MANNPNYEDHDVLATKCQELSPEELFLILSDLAI